MPSGLCVLILAAGAGSRLGGRPKCLIRCDGETLLQRLLRALPAVRPHTVVLVLGHHAPAIEAALPAPPGPFDLKTVLNPDPGEDPASSLRLGLSALPAACGAVMVLLADQPLLDADDLARAVQAFDQRPNGTRVLWPMVDGQPGHPVLFEAGVAHDLLTETGMGLKQWRLRHPATVQPWPSTNPHYTRDVDTPEDLQRLQQDTGMPWQLPT
jgi:molybdenum cofactor cytidylyltransferase